MPFRVFSLPVVPARHAMTKQAEELSAILVEIRKEKLNYRLMQNGTDALRRYAILIMATIVEKKLALAKKYVDTMNTSFYFIDIVLTQLKNIDSFSIKQPNNCTVRM